MIRFADVPALLLAAERILEARDEDAQTLLGSLQSTAVWAALLTGFRGDPSDLKSVVLALSQQRDTRSMSEAELQASRRAGRRQNVRRWGRAAAIVRR